MQILVTLIIVLFSCILPNRILFAQPDSLWTVTWKTEDYDAAEVTSVIPTANNEFVLAGSAGWAQIPYTHFWFARTDSMGREVFSSTIFTGRWQRFRKMIQLDNGDFLHIGDAVLRIDEIGTIIWAERWDQNSTDAKSVGEGDMVITGGNNLKRIDRNGEIVWTSYFTPDDLEPLFQSVELTADGGYSLAGWTSIYSDLVDYILLKTDSTGQEEWHTIYDFGRGGYCMDHLTTNDGGFLLIGSNLLLKVDEQGREIWSRNYEGYWASSGLNIGDDFILGGSGRSTIVREDSSVYTHSDFALMRINPDGDVLWQDKYGGEYSESCTSITQVADGGYAMAGYDGRSGILLRLGADPLAVSDNRFILQPSDLVLSAFPNPFNSSSTINYSLPSPGRYTIEVIDIQGRLVARLSDGWREAGSYREVFDGGELTSGEYFVKLNSNTESFLKPITIIK